MLYHPYVEAQLKSYHSLWCENLFHHGWLRVNIKRCLHRCHLSAVRWFSNSDTMNSFQWCQQQAGIFQNSPSLNRHRVTLQKINAFPARRQMCLLWMERSTNHDNCQLEWEVADESAPEWSEGCSFYLNLFSHKGAQGAKTFDEFLQGCFMPLHASSLRTSVWDVSDLMIGKALCHTAVF